MLNTIDPNRDYYDASGAFRMQAIEGALSNGPTPKDPRSADRTCL
jgi:hypothetical protein